MALELALTSRLSNTAFQLLAVVQLLSYRILMGFCARGYRNRDGAISLGLYIKIQCDLCQV